MRPLAAEGVVFSCDCTLSAGSIADCGQTGDNLGDEQRLLPNRIALPQDGMEGTVSAELNRHIVGEAYFIRGFC